MSFGTQSKTITIELTFEHEWDLGNGVEAPDSDYTYLDVATRISGDRLTETMVEQLKATTGSTLSDFWSMIVEAAS